MTSRDMRKSSFFTQHDVWCCLSPRVWLFKSFLPRMFHLAELLRSSPAWRHTWKCLFCFYAFVSHLIWCTGRFLTELKLTEIIIQCLCLSARVCFPQQKEAVCSLREVDRVPVRRRPCRLRSAQEKRQEKGWGEKRQQGGMNCFPLNSREPHQFISVIQRVNNAIWWLIDGKNACFSGPKTWCPLKWVQWCTLQKKLSIWRLFSAALFVCDVQGCSEGQEEVPSPAADTVEAIPGSQLLWRIAPRPANSAQVWLINVDYKLLLKRSLEIRTCFVFVIFE